MAIWSHGSHNPGTVNTFILALAKTEVFSELNAPVRKAFDGICVQACN